MSESSSTKTAAVQHHSFNTMPVEQLSPSFGRQYVYGQEAMLARIQVAKGCAVPEHHHVNEQISFILSGSMRFVLGGEERIVRAGEVLVIPSNLPHSGEALEDMIGFDVFAPPRADWISGDDAYLRR